MVAFDGSWCEAGVIRLKRELTISELESGKAPEKRMSMRWLALTVVLFVLESVLLKLESIP